MSHDGGGGGVADAARGSVLEEYGTLENAISERRATAYTSAPGAQRRATPSAASVASPIQLMQGSSRPR